MRIKRILFLAAVAALLLGLATLVSAAPATPGWDPVPPGSFGPTDHWLVIREGDWRAWPDVSLFYRSQWGLTTPMTFGPGALGQGTARDGWHKADSNLPDAAQTSGELAALDIGGNIVPGQGGTLGAYLQIECSGQGPWAQSLGYQLVDLDPGTGVNLFIQIAGQGVTRVWTTADAVVYGAFCAPPTGWTETPTSTASPTVTPPPTPTVTPTGTPPPTATASPTLVPPTPTPGVRRVYLPILWKAAPTPPAGLYVLCKDETAHPLPWEGWGERLYCPGPTTRIYQVGWWWGPGITGGSAQRLVIRDRDAPTSATPIFDGPAEWGQRVPFTGTGLCGHFLEVSVQEAGPNGKQGSTVCYVDP